MVSLNLTNDQQLALAGAPVGEAVPVFDAQQNRAYFLVPADVFERLQEAQADGTQIEQYYPFVDDVARHEGWDDP